MAGDIFHDGLATWYLEGGKNMLKIAKALILKNMKKLKKDGFQEPDEVMRQVKTLEGMLIGYSLKYKQDPQHYRVTADNIEKWFVVDCGEFTFKGKIDMLAMEGKRLVVFEHKAHSRIQDTFIETLPMDTEARGYIFGLTYGTGISPVKVVYNIVRKSQLRGKKNETEAQLAKRISDDYVKKPKSYFHREELRYSQADIATFERDLYITHSMYCWLIARKNARIDPTMWPCSDAECKSFGSTCPFLPLCTQGLNRGTAKLYTQYTPKDRRG
jgi:hypothetical protein